MVNPPYFDQLSETDQQKYALLRTAISAPTCRNRRNKARSTFQDVVDWIHTFVTGAADDQWKRSLVCGICWFDNSIAINRYQFSILTSRSKSSINGLFQSLGYGTIPSGCDAAAPLLTFFPFLRDNFAELRKWTVRQQMSATPNPEPLLTEIREHYSGRECITPPPAEPGAMLSADAQCTIMKIADEQEKTTDPEISAWDAFSFWDPEHF
jgi:hypothetical protein